MSDADDEVGRLQALLPEGVEVSRRRFVMDSAAADAIEFIQIFVNQPTLKLLALVALTTLVKEGTKELYRNKGKLLAKLRDAGFKALSDFAFAVAATKVVVSLEAESPVAYRRLSLRTTGMSAEEIGLALVRLALVQDKVLAGLAAHLVTYRPGSDIDVRLDEDGTVRLAWFFRGVVELVLTESDGEFAVVKAPPTLEDL